LVRGTRRNWGSRLNFIKKRNRGGREKTDGRRLWKKDLAYWKDFHNMVARGQDRVGKKTGLKAPRNRSNVGIVGGTNSLIGKRLGN